MRISIDWLKEFVSVKEDPASLADMLSMLGLEAEPVHDFSVLSGVVIGKVATAKKHPNADRLKLCMVNDGTTTVNVVCGAPNVAAGQTVAFAQMGAELPGGFKISKATIRGEESRGMICSERELGISDEHEGIMVLPDKLNAGTAINDYLSAVYDALDLDITPNRPDGF
jgi:phenylalanyl-tRNA synthetase beta chain